MNKSSKLTFGPQGWKVKVTYRSRNRMKFQLKLDQEQSESFRNFANSVKPHELSMDAFVQSIFFNGIRALEKTLTDQAIKMMQENREQYEASGFTFDEDGKLTGVDESIASGTIELVD